MGMALDALKDIDRIDFVVSLDSLIRELEAAPDEETPARWIHVASVGDWHHMSLGEVPISARDLFTVFDNFSSGRYPNSPVEVPVDYEHLSTKKERKPGDGQAAGWFKRLELRANGLELWGLVEWVKDAAKLIREKKYRFFSPTFAPRWIAHDKTEIGPVLFGGALTNYPTMPLRAITLSLDDAFDEGIGVRKPITQRGNPHMKIIKLKNAKNEEVEVDISSLGTLDLSQIAADVPTIKALQELAAKAPADGHIVVKKDEFDALKAKVPADGTTVVPAKELVDLKTDLATLSATVNTLKTENDTYKTKAAEATKLANEASVTALIGNGRILPAEKDMVIEMATTAPAVFDKFIATRKALPKPLIELNQHHGSGGAGGGGGDTAAAKLTTEINKRIADAKTAGSTLTYAEAARQVGRDPAFKELAQQAKEEETIEFASGPGGTGHGARIN